jgi:hypothetical protein
MHICSRSGGREARQKGFNDHLIDNFAASQQKVQRKVTVFIGPLG